VCELVRYDDLAREALHEDAPTRLAGGTEVVDLKGENDIHSRRRELRVEQGTEHDVLPKEGETDGQHDRQGVDAERDAAHARNTEELQALFAREPAVEAR
jgi:hypothetical protein